MKEVLKKKKKKASSFLNCSQSLEFHQSELQD